MEGGKSGMLMSCTHDTPGKAFTVGMFLPGKAAPWCNVRTAVYCCYGAVLSVQQQYIRFAHHSGGEALWLQRLLTAADVGRVH